MRPKPLFARLLAARLLAVTPAVLAPSLVLLEAGCGASVSAIYEGDVRFEHCMALDARPAASPSEQRMCWIEWVRYYTYGQTQDRVEYARGRASGSEGLSGAAPTVPPPLAAPEPTSAFAPPPMVAVGVDAGPDPPPPSPVPGGSAVPTAAAPSVAVDPACHGDCAEALEDCRTSCRGASCEKTCSGKLTRCLERCAETRGRPTSAPASTPAPTPTR